MEKHNSTYDRIDSLIHQSKLLDMMDKFIDLLEDIKQDEPFENTDIVKYVALRMQSAADSVSPDVELPSQRHDW